MEGRQKGSGFGHDRGAHRGFGQELAWEFPIPLATVHERWAEVHDLEEVVAGVDMRVVGAALVRVGCDCRIHQDVVETVEAARTREDAVGRVGDAPRVDDVEVAEPLKAGVAAGPVLGPGVLNVQGDVERDVEVAAHDVDRLRLEGRGERLEEDLAVSVLHRGVHVVYEHIIVALCRAKDVVAVDHVQVVEVAEVGEAGEVRRDERHDAAASTGARSLELGAMVGGSQEVRRRAEILVQVEAHGGDLVVVAELGLLERRKRELTEYVVDQEVPVVGDGVDVDGCE